MRESTRLAQRHEQFDIEAWTRIMTGLGFGDDASRARAMGIHHAQISRIRKGKSQPGLRFVQACTALGIPYPAIFRKRTAGAQQ